MRPDQLAKSGSEHAHQVALFAYAAMAMNRGFEVADAWAAGLDMDKPEIFRPELPFLRWFHAIPNGGERNKITAANLKAEGVRSGIGDTFLPVPCGRFHGCYIEMKKPDLKPVRPGASKGGLSDEQIAFKDHCNEYGYFHAVCYSWREGADALKLYCGQMR